MASAQERAIVVLVIATVFRVALLFKPAIGSQSDAAIDMTDNLIDGVERKHGRIKFDA